MTHDEAAGRRGEALRLFEAGLRAFFEATGRQPAPPGDVVREDRAPDGRFDLPAARVLEAPGGLTDAR